MKGLWRKQSTHPLEFRTELDGAVLIVRTTRGEGLVKWEGVVYRDDRPVATSIHSTYFGAVAWAEGVV